MLLPDLSEIVCLSIKEAGELFVVLGFLDGNLDGVPFRSLVV